MKRLLHLSCLLMSVVVRAQFGELGKFDCSYAKEILVPFDHSEDTTQKIKPLLKQKVFYSFRDQYTYWYKVVVKKDKLLGFKVKSINDSDAYSVYVYNYKGSSFCNDVFYQKTQPVQASFFVGKGSSVNSDPNQKSFNAKAGNVYYIGVLNTSVNNCGHRFSLFYGNDTLNVEALHLPCKNDVAALKIEKLKPAAVKVPAEAANEIIVSEPMKKFVTKNELSKDTLMKAAVSTPRIETSQPQEEKMIYHMEVFATNVKNHLPVEAQFNLIKKSSGETLETRLVSKSSVSFEIEKNQKYQIKVIALGYEPYVIELDGNNQISASQFRIEAALNPLKQGTTFIMKSIYFVPNTYALKKESLPELEKLLSYMTSNTSAVVEIQGHTNGDNRIVKSNVYANMGEEWNFSGSSKKLSQKRAEVIRTYLVNNGVSESRLIAKGYGGEKFLVKDPETNSEAQRNIRVEVMVLKD